MSERVPGRTNDGAAQARARASAATACVRDASARLRASTERVRLARVRLDRAMESPGRTPSIPSPRVRALTDDLARGAGLGPRADDDDATRERRRQNLGTLRTLVRDSLVRSGRPLPEPLRLLDDPPIEVDEAPGVPSSDQDDDGPGRGGRGRGHLLG